MTARQFREDTLLIASHNQHKIDEIKSLLADHVKHFSSACELNLPEPDETGTTFYENAKLKAIAAATASGMPALADDSGLCVTALNGAPGIYSARWAGADKNFTAAMQRIQDEIDNNPDRTAEFVCVLALAWPDENVVFAEGRARGTITWPPRGDYQFGYDPFFVPDGETKTFAELGPAQKEKFSHRAKAFEQLVKTCFQ